VIRGQNAQGITDRGSIPLPIEARFFAPLRVTAVRRQRHFQNWEAVKKHRFVGVKDVPRVIPAKALSVAC